MTALLFGGGIESSIIFMNLIMAGKKFEALWFDYGQNSRLAEFKSVSNFCKRHDVTLKARRADYLQGLTKNGSSLFGTDNSHIVDGRNLYFIMEALKTSDEVLIGSHRNDTSPDGSFSFLFNLSLVIDVAFRSQKKLSAPIFNDDLPAKIAEIEKVYPNFLSDTFSCWTPVNNLPCGNCKPCKKVAGLRI